jgi:rubrerythrin
MSYINGDVFVTLELPNGKVRKFKALTTSLEYMQDMIIDCSSCDNPFLKIPGRRRMRFTFEAIDEVVTTQNEIKERVIQSKRASEWMCEYCGTPNEKHNKTCNKCGAPRSFIYDY